MFNLIPTLTRGQAFVRGGLAAILGIVFVVWPDITIGTAVVLFAIYALASALMAFASVFDGAGASGGQRFLLVILGILDFAAAGVAIIWPGPTAAVLVLVIGFWAIFGGVAELFGAFQFSSGWLGLTGILSIAAGVVLVAWPGIGAVALAIVTGIYLATYGVLLLVAAAKTPEHARIGDPLAAGM
jgi:uncharacterized membrane protein HdeD (DUF308 family)